MTTTNGNRLFTKGYYCAGQCHECNGFGSLGSYCLECEDNAIICHSIDVDHLDYVEIGTCDNCQSRGLRGTVCTKCMKAIYKKVGDLFSDDSSSSPLSVNDNSTDNTDGDDSSIASDCKNGTTKIDTTKGKGYLQKATTVLDNVVSAMELELLDRIA